MIFENPLDTHPRKNSLTGSGRKELARTFFSEEDRQLLAELLDEDIPEQTSVADDSFAVSAQETHAIERLEGRERLFKAAIDSLEDFEDELQISESEAPSGLCEAQSAIAIALTEEHLSDQGLFRAIDEQVEEVKDRLPTARIVSAAIAHFTAGHEERARELLGRVESDHFATLRVVYAFAKIDSERGNMPSPWLEACRACLEDGYICRYTSLSVEERDVALHLDALRLLKEVSMPSMEGLTDIREGFPRLNQWPNDARKASQQRLAITNLLYEQGFAHDTEAERENLRIEDKAEFFAMRSVEAVQAGDPETAEALYGQVLDHLSNTLAQPTDHSIAKAIDAAVVSPHAKRHLKDLEILTELRVQSVECRHKAHVKLIEGCIKTGDSLLAQQNLDILEQEAWNYRKRTLPGEHTTHLQISSHLAYASGLAALGQDWRAPMNELDDLLMLPDGSIHASFHEEKIEALMEVADAKIKHGMDPTVYLDNLRRLFLQKRDGARSYTTHLLAILRCRLAWARRQSQAILAEA